MRKRLQARSTRIPRLRRPTPLLPPPRPFARGRPSTPVVSRDYSIPGVGRCQICASVVFDKQGGICGKGFWTQARREQRAISAWICEDRATRPATERTAARRVAPNLARGCVAPQSQPHRGGCSFVAPCHRPNLTQQMPPYLLSTTLVSCRANPPEAARACFRLPVSKAVRQSMSPSRAPNARLQSVETRVFPNFCHDFVNFCYLLRCSNV